MRLPHCNENYIKHITLEADFRKADDIDIIYKIIK